MERLSLDFNSFKLNKTLELSLVWRRIKMVNYKEMTCIVCPLGCRLKVELVDGDYKVSGNSCLRGQTFAINEIKNPLRTISSTVRTIYPDVPVLPVRVSADIPMKKIFPVMQEINKVLVKQPFKRGMLLLKMF